MLYGMMKRIMQRYSSTFLKITCPFFGGKVYNLNVFDIQKICKTRDGSKVWTDASLN